MNPKPPPSTPADPSGVTRETRPDPGEMKSDLADPGGASPDLRTQYERDQSSDATREQPRGVIRQAAKDLEAGLVDTDLRNTPGPDAERQRELLAREKGQSEQNSRKG